MRLARPHFCLSPPNWPQFIFEQGQEDPVQHLAHIHRAFAPPRRRDPQQHAPRPAYVPAWYLRERCGELKRAAATSRVCITISRVSLIVLSLSQREFGVLGRDCRTAKMRKRDACAIIASIAARIRLCVKTVVAGVRAKSLSSRGNSQSRKVENVRYVRYLIRGGGGAGFEP